MGKKATTRPQGVYTDEVLELQRMLMLEVEPTAIEMGPLVRSIQKNQPVLKDKALAELVGTYTSKIRYCRLALDLPEKVQEYIKDRKITMTIIEKIIPLYAKVPVNVLESYAGRVVEEKLNTDEARALADVVSSVQKEIARAKGKYTEEQISLMYETAVISPVREKGADPAEVALTISKYAKGSVDKPSLLLSPAQVKFAGVTQAAQPMYLRQRQKEFNKYLEGKGEVIIMRTETGFCVDIKCDDEAIPPIVRRMYASKPSSTEVYSDAKVDVQAQTIKVTDVFGEVLSEDDFIKVAEALRLGTHTTKGQKAKGKNIIRHIELGGEAYLVESRTDLDPELEMYSSLRNRDVIYTEIGSLNTAKYRGGRSYG